MSADYWENRELGRWVRLSSIGYDCIFITLLHYALSISFYLITLLGFAEFSSGLFSKGGTMTLDFAAWPEFILLLGHTYSYFKDCIGGRSVGKKKNNLQVVLKDSHEVAPPLRCVVRNLFLFVWPLELVVTLINPSRRIGDHVAGTKLIHRKTHYNLEVKNLKWIIISFLVSYGAILLTYLTMQILVTTLSN